MDEVTVNIQTESGLRASEIIADLQSVAETLYYPMRIVGFWDYQMDMHLCPQEERRQDCPHKLLQDDPNFVDYVSTLQRERRASLALSFPHANVVLYLS